MPETTLSEQLPAGQTGTPVLEVSDLSGWYGEAQALRNVSLTVRAGEVVTLVGRNGAGKSTTLRSVMGLHRHISGNIRLDGQDITSRAAERRARAGLGWVPDDRGIYASLTVMENLTLPPVVDRDAAWSLERIFEHFPVLHTRRNFPGTKLSGGEQQMLAMARPLRMGAKMLLVDEASEGLAPVIVTQIGDIIREIKKSGVSVLLVEQNVNFASTVADRHYLLAEGEVVESLGNDEFQSRLEELLHHLGM